MTSAEVFLSDCVLYRPAHCGTAHRTKERFASSVKDPEYSACWLKGSRLLACQHWINEDNSGLTTVLSLRTGTKRTQVLSPKICISLWSSLFSSQSRPFGSSYFWVRRFTSYHCDLGSQPNTAALQSQQRHDAAIFLNFFGYENSCHCCQTLRAIQTQLRDPKALQKK